MNRMKSAGLFCMVLPFVLMSASCAKEQASLKEVFAKEFLIGAAINKKQIYRKIPAEEKIIIKHFNTITPENVLKWSKVHPKPGVYNFDPVDKFVALGEKNNMFMVGHTLVWHSQIPDWAFEDDKGELLDRRAMLKRMKEHIFTVVGRYKGRIDAWDVVNEAVKDDGSLRDSKWHRIIGDDFIEKAFQYAHEADPNAKLYYNDYDMWKKAHRQGVYRLIKKMKADGIPIDGVGFQGHWELDDPKLQELEDSIKAFNRLGLKVMITELDVTVLPSATKHQGADISKNYELTKGLNPYTNGLPAEIQDKLASRYADLFSLLLKYSDTIERITFWGVNDGNSWRNNWPVNGRTDYPLLFDRDNKPKPAFKAVVKTVQK